MRIEEASGGGGVDVYCAGKTTMANLRNSGDDLKPYSNDFMIRKIRVQYEAGEGCEAPSKIVKG